MGPDPSLTPEQIQAQSFTTGFRGYDAAEVRSFLNRVGIEVRSLRERTAQLESAWHSAEERAARPPVLDEDTLMAAVGEETAAILRAARAAAADLRSRAGEESEKALADARVEAERIVEEAKGILGRETMAAEEAATRIVDAARAEAADVLEKTRIEADSIRANAEQERVLTIEGANSTRDRILEDLSRRRRVASVQIEQLRAGRERLIESYAVVRRTLEEAQQELSRADAEARAAADEVGRRMRGGSVEGLGGIGGVGVGAAEGEAPGVAVVGEPAGEVPAGEGSGSGGQLEEGSGPPSGSASVSRAPASEAGESTGEAGLVVVAAIEPGAGEAAEHTIVAEQAEASEHRGSNGKHRAASRRRGPFLRGRAGDEAPPATGSSIAAPPGETAADTGTESVAGEEQADPADVTAATVPASAPEAGSAVDELFARIKAGRPDESSDAAESPSAPSDEATNGSAPAEAAGEEPARADGDEALLQKRESAVVDLEVTLTRKLKRALQDEQNDLLDRLRGLRGEPTAARLLPDMDAQVARYADAAQPLVQQAASAGAVFAHDTLGLPSSAVAAPEVADLAKDAGTSIVTALRRRIEHAIDSTSDDDQSVLVESLGAAYREWKSHRIERIAGDALAAAFSRGTWEATPVGTSVRWIVEDSDGPCPDCDDDALAGMLPKGEAFPTGQHHPPAHTGCRCLLVPAAVG
jgi:DivIVA domain-containing protein